MKRFFLSAIFLFTVIFSFSQTITQRIDKAVQILLKDEQMKHAIMSLYVVETKTGKTVYHLNEEFGLSPASTQKIITASTAYELLGEGYRFKTLLGYDGKIGNNVLHGNLYITGYGDPTLGSWRYTQTKRDSVLNKILADLKEKNIQEIAGDIILDESNFSYQPLPGGWPWDDIGNYYGAGAWGIDWNENQYDILLRPGQHEGDSVGIKGTNPETEYSFLNFLKTGEQGSGDNAYIFMPLFSSSGFLEGSVPVSDTTFTISGSLSHPAVQFGKELKKILLVNNVDVTGEIRTLMQPIKQQQAIPIIIDSFFSPSLDSMVYWFLQKSINLYGEAFIKTIALENDSLGSTERGVELVKQFWQQRGIDSSAINMIDGSGLSPQNQITTKSLVEILQYAKNASWFNSFYDALPTYNNMKMKSGTIAGVKAFAGYHASRQGTQYTFAVIINNYDTSKGSIVQKLFKLLDALK